MSMNASEWEYLENVMLAASSATKSKQVGQQAGRTWFKVFCGKGKATKRLFLFLGFMSVLGLCQNETHYSEID